MLLIAMVSGCFGQAHPVPTATPAQPFVAGEVIVRFQSGSAMGKLVTSTSPDEAGGKGNLEAAVADRSRELGIPLRLKNLASGGELLLAVNLDELTAQLARHLRVAPGVTGVTMSAAGAPDRLGNAAELRVELREDGAQTTESRKADEVAGGLGQGFGHPLVARIGAKGEVLVALDAQAVTLQLIERLRSQPDVVHAQPNFLARKMR